MIDKKEMKQASIPVINLPQVVKNAKDIKNDPNFNLKTGNVTMYVKKKKRY